MSNSGLLHQFSCEIESYKKADSKNIVIIYSLDEKVGNTNTDRRRCLLLIQPVQKFSLCPGVWVSMMKSNEVHLLN